MDTRTYRCGPLRVGVEADSQDVAGYLSGPLGIYDVPWEVEEAGLSVSVASIAKPGPAIASTYLSAARMQVQHTAFGLQARCDSGATADFDRAAAQWKVGTPPGPLDTWAITDLEGLASLVVTTGWRDLGWVPFHAGMVCRTGGPAAFVCASSGGGKTTMTVNFIRRGWKTLGDDKLLIRRTSDGDVLEARSLAHHFNLFPHSRRWFPEIGDLAVLPKFSTWTEKRRVRIADFWPDVSVTRAIPTHVLQVGLARDSGRVSVTRLPQQEVLAVMLRQTVIPSDRQTAQRIVRTVADLAARLVGYRVEVGHDAYSDPECLAPLENALMSV